MPMNEFHATETASGGEALTIWYVATRACYVLVEASDEQAACSDARPALRDLYAGVRERLGRDVPIEIHTVRPATDDEIELWNWHRETVAREAARTEA